MGNKLSQGSHEKYIKTEVLMISEDFELLENLLECELNYYPRPFDALDDILLNSILETCDSDRLDIMKFTKEFLEDEVYDD